jgi:peptide/nickel transport system substrate-binding protein
MIHRKISKRDFLKLSATAGTLMAAPVWAQTTSATTTPPSAPRGQVIAGISQEPTVFNPLMPGSEVDQGVWWQLFSTLWFIDAQGNTVADLAREVPSVANGGLSADGLVWKVKLKTGATWHDGKPFTARDVKYTLELINNPAFRARNRVGHSLVRDITVVADDEIHWRMESSFTPYMSVLSQTFMVPEHILATAADPNTAPYNQAPVGTGPFRWGARRAGDHIQLEHNPAYHGQGPYLLRVIFKYIPDQTMLYTQFRSGQIDYLGLSGIQPSFEQEAAKLRGARIMPVPTPFIEHVALNLGFAPFADKSVRQALYLGMNKEARIKAIYQGRPLPTESYVPKGHWAYNDALPAHRYDPQAARALLDAAGWVPGSDGIRVKNGQRLAFTNSTTAGAQAREQSQQLLMQDWRQIGVEMTIENMPAAVIWGNFWQKSQYQSVMVASNFLQGSDPDVTARFSSASIPAKGGSGLNTYQYQNPEMDQLLMQGTREFNLDERKRIYHRIQEIVRSDLVLLPVSQTVIIEAVKDKLVGYENNINSSSNCWNMRSWYWAS